MPPPYTEALQRQLDAFAYATSDRGAAWAGEVYRGRLATAAVCAQYGSPFYWTAEFSHLLAVTAPDLPASWRLRPESLPVDYGFAWFAEPLALPADLLGEGHAGMPTVAVAWCALMDGGIGPIIPLHGVPPPRDGDHFAAVYFVAQDGDVRPHMVATVRVGETVGEMLERHRAAVLADDLAPRMQENVLTRTRFFPAALAFMEQRIAIQTREPADRATRRRIPDGCPIEPLIRVVQLRRPAEATSREPGERDVEWASRWIVTGHWRQQFYPSVPEHRPIFIESYIKGPEHLPVKTPRARIFAVVR